MPRYDDSKRYIMTGAVLNAMEREIATNRIIAGAGIGSRRLPGQGTEVWVGSGGSTTAWWDLEVVSSASRTVRLLHPGRIKRTTALDASGLVAVGQVDSTFTAAADKWLVLEVQQDLTTTLKMVDEWDSFPFPIETEETTPPGLWVMKTYYHPLWAFLAAPTADEAGDPSAVAVGNGLWAVRMGFDAHLQFALTDQEDKDGHVVSAFELLPSTGAKI